MLDHHGNSQTLTGGAAFDSLRPLQFQTTKGGVICAFSGWPRVIRRRVRAACTRRHPVACAQALAAGARLRRTRAALASDPTVRNGFLLRRANLRASSFRTIDRALPL